MAYDLRMEVAEEVGKAVYRAAGCDPARPPRLGSAQLACAIFGSDILRLQPHAFAEATVATILGKRQIVVRRELQIERMNFGIARQLSRIWLEGESWYEGMSPGERALTDRRVGAWLVAPTEAVQEHLHRRSWLDVGTIAAAFTITETCATMRISESGGPDSVIATPMTVHRRGSLLSDHNDAEVRDIASKRFPKNVLRRVIQDELGRVALLARSA